MADKINTNVFDAEKKFVDFSGLDYFWGKAKTYIDDVDAAMSAKVVTLENTVGDSTKGLVKDVKSIQDELNSLSGGAGSIATQIDNAIAALDLPNTYETKGAAATAEQNAKADAEAKYQVKGDYEAAGAADAALAAAKADAAEKYQVKGDYEAAGAAATVQGNLDTHKADAVAHVTAAERADWNAAKTAIDTFLTDADMTESAVDTLKELQSYMTADGEAAAELVNRVAALEAIEHDAYIAADAQVLADAKADAEAKYQVKGNYEAAGAADAALADAKADATSKANAAQAAAEATAAADATTKANAAQAAAEATAASLYQPIGDYEAAGTAAAAIEALDLANTYEAKGAAADAQAAAIAQAKLDAAEALKSYYTKTEVDNLLSTNSTGDRAYAKSYTDELFDSIKFAANSDIDTIFA